MAKVTIKDLQVAQTWLRNDIDCADIGDERQHEIESLLRVDCWIGNEILKREDAAYVRGLAKQVSQSTKKVRAALRRRDVTHESN